MAKPGSPIFKCSRRNEVIQFRFYRSMLVDMFVVNIDSYTDVKIG